ncbi:hypothetical protein FS837_012258 [Tulasnella sp. UAMH 9824]|nr:hypothetical protein FS837_012258 [Tulasnella sp. UAMH 9824]
MNPATTATVDLVIDLLLQSISDENRNALEAVAREDPTINTWMLAQVDNYAGAIKSTLDAVQGHLLRRMSALHTEHNRMIPLHQLPIEIFVQILTGVLGPFQTRGWSRRTHLGRLVTLCRVCKRWREVIRSAPPLWTTIDIFDPAATTSAAISLSANHPLNILGASSPGSIRFWGDVPERWKEFSDTVIIHSTRWRSIQLNVAASEVALAIMNAPAPRLQSLELKSSVQCRVYIEDGGDMFQATRPHLRRLGLHGVAVPWRPWTLGGLRHLSLSGLGEFAPSYEEMLGILRECPRLEELALSLRSIANVEASRRNHPFTLAQLRSITFASLSPSWAFALLETIRTPSVKFVVLDLNFSDSGHLLLPVIKRARTLLSTIIDTQYELSVMISPSTLDWSSYPFGIGHNRWNFRVTGWGQQPVSELVELILLEKDANRFPPESISIDLEVSSDSQFSQILGKLDGVEHIHIFEVNRSGLEHLFTYMSNRTSTNEWGLPELEIFNLYDCYYDPSQLLSMVLTRYGSEGSAGNDISGTRRDRPPALKNMTINHAPGEADEDTLDLVKDIVGHECLRFYEDVER